MIKTEKILHLRSSRGRKVRVVREHYLRERVPCLSRLCLDDGCENDGKLLPADLTHYVVPDVGVVLDFLEVLELPKLQGLIFTQTACQALQSKGRRYYQRLRSLLKDPGHDCVLFANDFQEHSYCPREKGESLESWQTRSVYSAAVWYYNHLAGLINVVMITGNQDAVTRYGSQNSGVFVVTLQDYLQNFWPRLQEAHQLFASTLRAQQQMEAEDQKEFPEHLPATVLEAGLKSGRYVQGSLNVSKHRAQSEALVQTDGRSQENTDLSSGLLVCGWKHRNRAVHGDLVVAELLPRSEWRGRGTTLTEGHGDETEDEHSRPMATGRVVGILQRNWRDYVVTFPPRDGTHSQTRSSQRILAVPWDRRIPKIRISTQQADALQEQRVVVRIDSWDSDSLYPNGHSVRVLGQAGQLETEVQTILIENGIHVPPFSEAQLREMPVNSPEKPWTVDEAEAAQRLDLRKTHLVFSIDPPGCEDVDDTLSLRRLAGGKLELGVHIADVSHFVAEGSFTDLEARARATTYYLADRRYDMLPPVLSGGVCSLLGGVDRYAVSVLWELDAESLSIGSVWFGRTVIRSSYQLHYEQAQALLDGESTDVPELAGLEAVAQDARRAELLEALQALTRVARHLRALRDRGGALELEGVEVRAQLDKQRNIQALVPRQPLEIHETVAECMIHANHWVAQKIQQRFPSRALLRRHPPPRHQLFVQLLESAAARGFSLDTSTNKSLADSLDRALDPQDPLVNRLLRMMATQAMSPALYFSTGTQPEEQFYHYGLALDRYTHFTSPIRRYGDVLVHRQLLAALEADGTKTKMMSSSELEETAQHINGRNRAAQHAQTQSTALFQCLYFKDKDPETDPRCLADAVVYGLKDNGLLVFVPQYALKGAVYLRNQTGQVLTESDPDGGCDWQVGSMQRFTDHVTTTSSSGSSTFRLFEHVTVRISVRGSWSHSDSLKLELLRKRVHADGGERGGRSQLLQEVQRQAEEEQWRAEEARRPCFSLDEEEFLQSQSPSLYSLLEEVRELALRELLVERSPAETIQKIPP